MKLMPSLRKRRYLAIVSVFLITAALIALVAGCEGESEGEDWNPTIPPSQNLEIRTWHDLNAVRDNPAGSHTLMNDLDSTTAGYEELASPASNGGKGWEPIATYVPEGGFVGFMGTVEGQGYEIRDLFINRPDEDAVGLFRSILSAGAYGQHGEGVVRDIGVVYATVTGNGHVGGLMGSNRGTVSNSYFTGNVTGEGSYVGGLAGSNHGTVSTSSFTGALTGDRWVGGLVGCNGETVSNSYSNGSVTGNDSVGGLVGLNDGHTTLSDSHSSSSVTGVENVGGLVGDNGYAGTVNDCYFSGSVIGDAMTGGLVGLVFYGTVSNSYYNYDEVFINGGNMLTVGALFDQDFDQWLANDKFLDVSERLSQESGYYVMNNVTDFKQLLAFGQNSSLKFRLKTDLDLGDEPNFYVPYFAAEFDGNGHKIFNLSLNLDSFMPLGLFGYLAPDGKVSQVGVENVNITGAGPVGGLVGYIWKGTVSNCHCTGNVIGNQGVGGLVGLNSFGTVSNSYTNVDVSGYWLVGGLAGDSWGTMSSCHSTSTVTGYVAVGGLAGSNDRTLSDCYATGNVAGNSEVGGLLGHNGATGNVINSYSIGDVSGNLSVGGLVGVNSQHATVSNSYSTGSVTGNVNVGGLVGISDEYQAVNNSFWDIETSGQATSDGGTGKTTAEMQDITTFLGTTWDMIEVANPSTRNTSHIWNIVDNETYPFLSWQS